MPKVNIDHRTLDGMVVAGLRDTLNTLIDEFRMSQIEEDKEGYLNDITAIEHVLRIYE